MVLQPAIDLKLLEQASFLFIAKYIVYEQMKFPDGQKFLIKCKDVLLIGIVIVLREWVSIVITRPS